MSIREAVDYLTKWRKGPFLGLTGLHETHDPVKFDDALKTLLMEFEYRDFERRT